VSAAERLAAAVTLANGDSLEPGWGKDHGERFADGMLSVDPHLAQDIEDGRALRELREAAGPGWHPVTIWFWDDSMLVDGPEFKVEVKVRDRVFRRASGPTIAAAADAAREALRDA
jgi:hypothetical protein